MNTIYVHAVPGIFYIALSILYLPKLNILLKNRVGFEIPMTAKIIFGLLVLWGTLAVGDLAEVYGL